MWGFDFFFSLYDIISFFPQTAGTELFASDENIAAAANSFLRL